MDDDEREIRECLAAGDVHQAARLCLRVHHRRIMWFLTRRLNNADAAKDLFADFCHELWIRLLNRPPAENLRVLAWLFGIAHNARRRWFRRLRRTPNFVDADLEDLCQRSFDGISRQFARKAELDRLRALLSEEERKVLALVYEEGLTSAEVADILGKTPEAVRAHVYRIKIKLRKDAA